MAISDAKKFIRISQRDREFRGMINLIKTEELFSALSELGYRFTIEEFEEAVNMMHVQCQFESEADALMQTSMWFRMLNLKG